MPVSVQCLELTLSVVMGINNAMAWPIKKTLPVSLTALIALCLMQSSHLTLHVTQHVMSHLYGSHVSALMRHPVLANAKRVTSLCLSCSWQPLWLQLLLLPPLPGSSPDCLWARVSTQGGTCKGDEQHHAEMGQITQTSLSLGLFSGRVRNRRTAKEKHL